MGEVGSPRQGFLHQNKILKQSMVCGLGNISISDVIYKVVLGIKPSTE